LISADTHLFIYAANPESSKHGAARSFFDTVQNDPTFVTCELVLVEVYMQLRNPAVMRKPLDSKDAAAFCKALRTHPVWQHVDYDKQVSGTLWTWAAATKSGFRRMIDARLALTLLHHGITDFATANVSDFQSFPFRRIWSPL
jgi:toxin-antitoxin system PIN domain toxin